MMHNLLLYVGMKMVLLSIETFNIQNKARRSSQICQVQKLMNLIWGL